MPATNPRVSTVVEPELWQWLRRCSHETGKSMSVIVRDILAKSYADEEERLWAAAGEERLRTFDHRRAVSHEDAWK